MVLPALGECVTEGTVTRWLKKVGDTVEADEPLLEVSTDKVDTEIPSPVAGMLLEIDVGEDETVDVGTTLATIGPRTAPRHRRPPPHRHRPLPQHLRPHQRRRHQRPPHQPRLSPRPLHQPRLSPRPQRLPRPRRRCPLRPRRRPLP